MAVLVCPDDSVPEVYAILLNSAPVRAPAACQPPAAPAAPRARAAPALATGLTRRARRWLIQRARALPQAAPELQPALARARARLAAARLPILAAPPPRVWVPCAAFTRGACAGHCREQQAGRMCGHTSLAAV